MTQPEVNALYEEWSRLADEAFALQRADLVSFWATWREADVAWRRYLEAAHELAQQNEKAKT